MREYLLTLCITAAVTYLLTGPVRKFAIVAGAMPEIRARDVHREPTPRLGGIAMFFGLCAGLLVADHLTNLGEVFDSNEPRALLSGAALIWLIGVLDDKFEIDALVKLGGQLIAAGVMVMQGLTMLWLPVPGVGQVLLTSWQGNLLTIALVLITINAVNFVDGLDGLAAGMVCIAATAFFMHAYRIWYGYGLEAAAPAALFAALLMGMCLGFLPHNMHPARIFMGDSGSMLIGLVLAAGAISITGQVDPDAMGLFAGSEKAAVHQTVPVYMPLLLPLTIIAVPAADLVLAVVRRTWRGQSPFAADRGHLHHRLLEIGHSHSRAVLIMYFWSALIAFGALAYSVNEASMWVALGVAALSAVGLVLLLLPRFTPRAPRWAEAFVPPRYRRRVTAGPREDGVVTEGEPGAEGAEPPARVAVGVAGANGATAVGERSRFQGRGGGEREKATSTRS
ncbi:MULTISPECIES: MraY family glycosyltransferase [Streptomyces]|uniref:Undecaprenyl/decaprenyl-phosphate alpha-N-acetylglucosaminyl 1-phosphate transferase n=1 Tax=Streptomyces koyangensis TaxID=188770 RepID=A0A385D9J0_9ACTN|nr:MULTISPECIES: MraY family glycosyltransferase [Streptomyces]WTD05399.1 undecaprenyl/decaprenyl-phosphate alpha-N-acetylglucosaminyl 1-phosphate transferase [Streptomyces albidoflavus]AXQ54719.1 undecaprenyl/decaprenyl-phosphate alpha-N-acetylglucosaminyl 1-phosphate transferase [Streptomyces koyangensis]MBV7251135.1 undecaprenyl/decaprenyl-phosphate alpha-N-acetylglucosaminyl 1-phosphate transferase [Streptomyces sp. S-2]PKR45332.1 undecaprenyl-phosphate alpha-N-acetylglucosaminyl 1-phosphat